MINGQSAPPQPLKQSVVGLATNIATFSHFTTPNKSESRIGRRKWGEGRRKAKQVLAKGRGTTDEYGLNGLNGLRGLRGLATQVEQRAQKGKAGAEAVLFSNERQENYR